MRLTGHAIECRINAEDPDRGFFPSPGTIERFTWPEGVRVDAGFRTGSVVTPFYDSLVAKLIVHAADREAAISALQVAVDETRVDGIRTTLPSTALSSGPPLSATWRTTRPSSKPNRKRGPSHDRCPDGPRPIDVGR